MGFGLAGIYFSVPGQPCSSAGANMSAEVSCINAATSAAADLPKLKVRCTSQPAPAEAHFSEVPSLFCGILLGVWVMLTCLVRSQLKDVVLELCSSCQFSVFESRSESLPGEHLGLHQQIEI